MKETYANRLHNLARAQQDSHVDLVAIVPGANLRYLTGLQMHTSERITVALFPAGGQPVFVLPVLEAPRAEASLGFEASLYTYTDEQGPGPAFRQMASDLALKGWAGALLVGVGVERGLDAQVCLCPRCFQHWEDEDWLPVCGKKGQGDALAGVHLQPR